MANAFELTIFCLSDHCLDVPHRKMMNQHSHPITDQFNRCRAGLANSLGISRYDIQPETELAELIPAARRREVWSDLRVEGIRLPALELPPRLYRAHLLAALRTAASCALWFKEWFALLVAVPLGIIAYGLSRPWAVELPLGIRTAWEMAVYATDFWRHPNHPWAKDEIEFKVRLILVEVLNIPLEAVRPECTLRELGAD